MDFNAADTAWILVATALVFLMTPAGLSFFYGGLSNRRSVINTVGMSYAAMCMATLAWIVVGYSLAFGEGGGEIVGKAQFLLSNIGLNDLEGSIPKMLFVAFQGVFAAIAVAIISGSVIERIKFGTWLLFSFLWVILVYCPLVYWIWGNGFLSGSGELDFAGGTVIHVNAGIAGLVMAMVLGRRSFSKKMAKASSVKLTVLGAALLWFGWFGFNAGSQLAADAIAANAFMVTNTAACMGGLGWLLAEWISTKKITILGLTAGVVSALVGITPASGYVDVAGALLIGLSSGIIGYYGVNRIKPFFGYDDSLDAFGIHGLVGIWGMLATGLFANPEINGAAGLFYGNAYQLVPQLISLAVTIAFSSVATLIVYFISSLLTGGGKIDHLTRMRGVDSVLHDEEAFDFD
ncbi:MAG: ammonium transporter [Chlorobi bacterium]|nr:ammonium transporter [Chlorobiota bacterium]